MDWSLFFGELVSGLTLGSIYALIALGYTMVYGILKLLNFAHGDVYMVGAFVAFFMSSDIHVFPSGRKRENSGDDM